MKHLKKHLKAILLAAALLVAGTVAAQGPGSGMMHGKDPGHPAIPGLNLTDEQRTRFEDLRLKHLREIEPLRADLEKQRSALALEITAEKYNEASVKTIQNEISKVQNTIAMKGIAHRRAVRDLLTPEQQKKFDARLIERGGGPGFGGMGAGHGRGSGGSRCGHCQGCWN